MENFIGTFERFEKKYLLTPAQYAAVRRALEPYAAPDQYGRHTILSVYYDTDDCALVRASLAKPRYKEKLRLRSYGTPGADSTVYLEIKKKWDGVVYKRREALTLTQARAWDAAGVRPADSQIWHELDWMRRRYDHLTPHALIAYERVALAGTQDAALRMTFDFDIRWRASHLDLAAGSSGEALAPGLVLLEVKFPAAMPLWMARLFSELGVRPTSFSKYGSAYEQFLAPQAAIFPIRKELIHA